MIDSLWKFAPMPRAVVVAWALTALLTWLGLIASLPGYYNWFVTQPLRENFSLQHTALTITIGIVSLLCALICLSLAMLIFLRKPGDWGALYVSFFLLIYGFMQVGPLERLSYILTDALLAVSHRLPSVLFTPMMIILLMIFPNGKIAPRQLYWIFPPLALLLVMTLEMPLQELNAFVNLRSFVWFFLSGGLFLLALGGQVYRYLWISTPIERQQTKIVIFGITLEVILLGISSVDYFNQSPEELNTIGAEGLASYLLWVLGLIVLPISLTVAVVRSHLWDIDVVIRKTVIYGILTAALAGVYFAIVIFFQYTFRLVIGHESPIAIVLTTLVIAALFTPLRGGIQAVIDRRFFRSKYNAEQALARFQYSMRDRVDLEGLEQDLTGIVQTTVQPEWVGLWIREPGMEGKTAGNTPGG